MNAFEGALLGALQGATEFLPVSSSGHLSLAEAALGAHPPSIFFDIALHLGTLVAVVLVFRGPIVRLSRGLLARDAGAWRALGLLVAATVPTVAIALVARKTLEARLPTEAVGGLLLLNGVVLLATARARKSVDEEEDAYWRMPFRTAILIGIAQGFAVLPGISRSGSTIAASLFLGVAARPAATFSFLLSIPAILGAAVLTAKDLGSFSSSELSASLIGAAVAAVVGAVALRVLLGVLAKARFHHFAWWCFAVGIAGIVFGLA